MQKTTLVAKVAHRGGFAPNDWQNSFLDRIESFPTPSEGCRQLYFYLQGPGRSVEGAMEWVAADPLLAIEVIRSSKAAVYGARGARSLDDAVLAIGLERLGRVVLRLWLRNMMPRRLAAYDLDGGTFVRRSVACGASMRYLYQGDSDQSETAYAVGLLHSIGRVIVDLAARSRGDCDLVFGERTARRLAELEFLEFGTTHPEVGGLALKHWGFSEKVYGPVAAQFSSVPGAASFDLAESLAIARFIADRVMEALAGGPRALGSEGRAIFKGRPLSEVFEYSLGIVEDELETLLN